MQPIIELYVLIGGKSDIDLNFWEQNIVSPDFYYHNDAKPQKRHMVGTSSNIYLLYLL